jgi:hypothetical protein
LSPTQETEFASCAIPSFGGRYPELTLNYGAEYAQSPVWIDYRVGAEEIRSQIYLYRTSSPPYSDPEGRKEKLVDVVRNVYQRLSNSNFVPFMRSRSSSMLKREILEHCYLSPGTSNSDNGPTPLTVKEYIDWRILRQIDWYGRAIMLDYRQKRRATIAGLLIVAIGSVIVSVFEPLTPIFALTTAGGIALTLWSNVRTTGATYRLFQRTATDLKLRLNSWNSLSPEAKQKSENIFKFVEDMETIFATEIKDWETTVKQMQQLAEQEFDNMRQAHNNEIRNKQPPTSSSQAETTPVEPKTSQP